MCILESPAENVIQPKKKLNNILLLLKLNALGIPQNSSEFYRILWEFLENFREFVGYCPMPMAFLELLFPRQVQCTILRNTLSDF